jgi:tetratricopeptide (TPR) repeat protein
VTTLEDDLRVASDALGQGDLKHAAHHLADAVAAAPLDLRVTKLVDRFASVEGALDAVAMGDGVYHGTAALRALLLHRRGRSCEAVDLLWGGLSAASTADYLSCIEQCLDGLSAGAIDGGAQLYRSASNAFDGLPARSKVRAAGLLVRIAGLLPEDDWAFFTACVTTRKAAKRPEAEAQASARVKARPSYPAYVALAGALREKGDYGGAVEAFQNASRLAPDEPGCLLDCGDLLIDLRRHDDALRAYEQALAIAPRHPWAHPSALFLRARGGDDSARVELLNMAGGDDAPERARELATQLAPFDFDLPPRHDACLAALRGASPEDRPVAVASSSLEAPSAYRVLRLLCGPKLRISARVPTPDPRIPKRPVLFAVWRYERPGWRRLLGGELPLEATPGVDPPAPDTGELVAELARRPYSRDAWWQHAATIVDRLRERSRATALGSMVHWPGAGDDAGLADAAFRAQVASAYVLARAGEREALVTILQGPADWAGSAALVGLTELAVREGDRTARDLVVATALDEDVNPIRWQCLIEPALQLSALLPDLDAETGERLALRRQDAEV